MTTTTPDLKRHHAHLVDCDHCHGQGDLDDGQYAWTCPVCEGDAVLVEVTSFAGVTFRESVQSYATSFEPDPEPSPATAWAVWPF